MKRLAMMAVVVFFSIIGNAFAASDSEWVYVNDIQSAKLYYDKDIRVTGRNIVAVTTLMKSTSPADPVKEIEADFLFNLSERSMSMTHVHRTYADGKAQDYDDPAKTFTKMSRQNEKDFGKLVDILKKFYVKRAGIPVDSAGKWVQYQQDRYYDPSSIRYMRDAVGTTPFVTIKIKVIIPNGTGIIYTWQVNEDISGKRRIAMQFGNEADRPDMGGWDLFDANDWRVKEVITKWKKSHKR